MPSSYPGALDAFTNPDAGAGDTLDDPPHDSQHADANDAIEAVETELGVNPRGSHADVRARLDDIDANGRGLRQIVTFTAGGTFTKADYPWLRTVRPRVQAAGGGGGGQAVNNGGGAGGGAGGYAESLIPVEELAASETVTVGSGGSGGVTGQTAGGVSSFGTHVVANGGQAAGTDFNGGTGGTATAGDIQIRGGDGHPSSDASLYTAGGVPGGNGGDSQLGHGGRGSAARAANVAGEPGRGYGAGGGGSYRRNANVNGGAGADGIVILELYA